MALDYTATPGTHIPGPIRVEALDPNQTAFDALPADISNLTGGTPDTTNWELQTVTDAVSNDNFATIAIALRYLLERIQ